MAGMQDFKNQGFNLKVDMYLTVQTFSHLAVYDVVFAMCLYGIQTDIMYSFLSIWPLFGHPASCGY